MATAPVLGADADTLRQMGCDLLRLVAHSDGRGGLIAIDEADVGFQIRRSYSIFNVPAGQARGGHAHHRLRQALNCPAGGCSVVLDDGDRRVEVALRRPTDILLIGGMIWREMHWFAPNTVLNVLADALYDEAEYIRSWPEFQALKHRTQPA